MKPIYGAVIGYQPDPGGFAQFLSFALTPGSSYDQQLSTDGGATWVNFGVLNIPPNIPPTAASWSSSLMFPNGLPVRLVPK